MIGYSLVQAELVDLPVDSLIRAFKVLPELVDLDAATMARDAYGIIADALPGDAAARLQQALAAEGIRAEVVADHLLPKLPSQQRFRRIECRPEHLVICDSLDRPHQIGWPHVKAVCAGIVPVHGFRRKEKTRIVRRGGPRGGSYPIPLTDVTHERKVSNEYWLEIFLDVEPARFHGEADKLFLSYLGDRIRPKHVENFITLVRDLAGFAANAGLNRGTVSFCTDSMAPYEYPSAHAFEEEAVWLLWRQENP